MRNLKFIHIMVLNIAAIVATMWGYAGSRPDR